MCQLSQLEYDKDPTKMTRKDKKEMIEAFKEKEETKHIFTNTGLGQSV